MSPQAFLVIHLFGVFMVVTSLAAAAMLAMSVGSKNIPHRRWLSLIHGLGLLITLIAGFGMLGMLHLGFPGWAVGKLVIWLLLGGAIAVVLRKPSWGMLWLTMVILLATCAAYLAVFKPF